MGLKQKLLKFLEYCDCISSFDKYFWRKQIQNIDNEKKLSEIYQVLLKSENKLLHFELQSIYKIKDLIEDTYPELKDKYLPEFKNIYSDYETIQGELTELSLKKIKNRLKKIR